MAFPQTRLDVIVQLALGADLTDSPGLWSWTTITQYVHMPSGITITRGRGDEFATAPPCRIALTLINTDGRFCPRNPEGPYYGLIARNTPLRIRVNAGAGYVTQAVGFVDQWPVSWADKRLSASFAPITASGLLRRLGQSGAQRSALYRRHALLPFAGSTDVVGYWPCEDEAGSTSIASGIGGRSATLSGGLENFAADSTIAGSDPLMQLEPGVSFAGYLGAYTATGTTAIRAIVKFPAAPSGTIELLRWWTSGSYTVWTVELVPGSPDRLFLKAFNTSGVEQLAGTGANMEDNGAGRSMLGRQLYLLVDLVENAGAIDWQILAYDDWAFNMSSTGAIDGGTEASATVGTLEAIGSYNHSAAAAETTLGHIAVATGGIGGAAAAVGFAGSSVSIRYVELAVELDINALNSGSDDVSKRTYVGASDAKDIVELFRELETAEQGILYDGKTGFLELLLREDRYNRDVELALDHDAGQIDYLAPTDDDQQIVNDVTVSRPHGSEFRAFDSEHIAVNGSYATTVEALLFQDSDLPYHAQWRVHLGTVEELRYPRIGLNFARIPTKLADWLACDIGSRIQITNPPAGLPPDTIDVHVEGYTEYLSPVEYRVELNCSPASPWQVFEVEGANLGRLDTSGSELVVAPDADDTELAVATPGGALVAPLWGTQTPYDIEVAGERMTVTAVGSSQNDTFGRVTSNGWGGNWTTVGTASDFSTDGGEADINVSAITSARVAYLPTSLADAEILADKIVIGGGVVPTGASISTALLLRYQDLSNFLLGELLYSTSDTVTARIVSWVSGTPTVLASQLLTGLSGSGTAFAARFAAHGPELYLRVWNRATAEPGAWTATAYSTALTTAGKAGIWLLLNTGNTNTLPLLYAYDGVQVTNPQALTVTRSVNGVAKAHTVGAAVKLWKPGVISL